MDMKRLNAEYDKLRQDTKLSQAMIEREKADVRNKDANTALAVANAKREGLKLNLEQLKSDTVGTVSNVQKDVSGWFKEFGRKLHGWTNWPDYPEWMNEVHNRKVKSEFDRKVKKYVEKESKK